MANPDVTEGGYANAEYWRVERVQIGYGFGMRRGDAAVSDTVSMDLWCYDLDKPGRFALDPDHAEQLAHALLDAVQKVRGGSHG